MGDESVTRRRVEIVHESLLREWPRLVRWQTQDLDGAQLRDQLRQAAQLWEERGRLDDLLWTGTAFREFDLWREQYPGGLTESEESFATAMIRRAHQLRRRRQVRVSALLAALLVVVVVVAASRQQEAAARQEAERAAMRAEAQKLVALGQVTLEESPTLALAYATKSLELADSPEARRFVLVALAAGPPATLLPLTGFDLEPLLRGVFNVNFSGDGAWAAFGARTSIRTVSRDGERQALIEPFEMTNRNDVLSAFDPSGQYLFSLNGRKLGVWTVPGFELVEEQEVPLNGVEILSTHERQLVASVVRIDDATLETALTSHAPGREPVELGRIELPCPRPCSTDVDIDPSGQWVAYPDGKDLRLLPVDDMSRPPLRVGSHPARISSLEFDSAGTRIATYDERGDEIRIWSLEDASGPQRVLVASGRNEMMFDPSGRRVAAFVDSLERTRIHVWDLEAPQGAAPLTFPVQPLDEHKNVVRGLVHGPFTPDGRWVVALHGGAPVSFWPIEDRRPTVLPFEKGVEAMHFTPDGNDLIILSDGVRVLPLDPERGPGRVLDISGLNLPWGLDVDPGGDLIALGSWSATQAVGVSILALDGGARRTFFGFAPNSLLADVQIDPDGRRVAVSTMRGQQGEPVIKIWDIETGAVLNLGRREAPGESMGGVGAMRFLSDGSLLSGGSEGLSTWSLDTGTQEVLVPEVPNTDFEVFDEGRRVAHLVASPNGRRLAVTRISDGTTQAFPEHGDRVSAASAEPSGRFLVTGDEAGVIRIGALGEEPHLLLGHEGRIVDVRVSPDGQWIASRGRDRTIRLWSVPDLSRTPLHALPNGELIERLHTFTNVHLVEDRESSTGWKIEVGPFPGWEEVPEW